MSERAPSEQLDSLQAIVADVTASLHRDFGDPFRRQYVALTSEQGQMIERLKDEAISTYGVIHMLPPSRERSLALTCLEEAVMWAAKAVSATPRS